MRAARAGGCRVPRGARVEPTAEGNGDAGTDDPRFGIAERGIATKRRDGGSGEDSVDARADRRLRRPRGPASRRLARRRGDRGGFRNAASRLRVRDVERLVRERRRRRVSGTALAIGRRAYRRNVQARGSRRHARVARGRRVRVQIRRRAHRVERRRSSSDERSRSRLADRSQPRVGRACSRNRETG